MVLSSNFYDEHPSEYRQPSVTELFVLVWLALVAMIYWKIHQLKHEKSQLPFPNIPYTVPSPHWLTGHLRLLGSLEGQHELVCQHAGGSNEISTCWTFRQPVFTARRASTVNKILMSSAERQNHPAIRRHFQRWVGKHGLLMMNGSEWRMNRDIVQKSFRRTSLRATQGRLVKIALRIDQAVLHEMNEDGVLVTELVGLSRMACLDVFGVVALGHDFECTNGKLRKSDMIRQLTYLQSELTRRCYEDRFKLAAQFYWIPTSSNRRLARENKAVRTTLAEIVARRRADGQRNDDLLSNALQREFRDLPDEVLSDWLVTSLFGGYETTALAVSYMIYFLAKHPNYQEECAREVAGVIDWNGLVVERDLVFCLACFWESLRCCPPVSTTARTLQRDLDVDLDKNTVTLKKGTRCFFSLYWIHHAEINFQRPDDFLPERWAQKTKDTGKWEERTVENDRDESLVQVGNRSAIFSFSAGARNCVGKPLAVCMAPIVAAALLRSCRFDLEDPNYVLKLKRSGASQVPSGGIPVRITQRRTA